MKKIGIGDEVEFHKMLRVKRHKGAHYHLDTELLFQIRGSSEPGDAVEKKQLLQGAAQVF